MTTRQLRLDQSNPPEDEVRFLEPGEGWELQSKTVFYLNTSAKSDAVRYPRVSWDSLKRTSTVWMRLNCEVWPLNLEPKGDRSKRSFGRKLQEQWSNLGTLQLEPLMSEPMILNLAGVHPAPE